MPTTQQVTLRSRDGVNHELLIDSKPLPGVREAKVVAKVNCIAEVHLVLNVYDVEAEADRAAVVVPEATREALKALGWTPPAHEPLCMIFHEVGPCATPDNPRP